MTKANDVNPPDLQKTFDEVDFHSLPDDVAEALGEGRFKDILYVSSGATSSVFSAHDNAIDKRVAIKFLTHASEQRLMNFQTEARTACKLDHQNLVKILNFGVTKKNHAFLIMDFVSGSSLEAIVEEHGALPIETVLDLLDQICDGMAHSHGKGIVHRDLKTSNIIIQGFGTSAMKPIVVDFGLAKERQSQDKTSQGSSSGKVKGSPLYISPEQAKGQHGDERSDIYSLGCIAFRIITGRVPFEANDLFELLRKHIEEPAPTLQEMAPDTKVNKRLEYCVNRMLEKEPDKRFQNIAELKEAIAAVRRSLVELAPTAVSLPGVGKKQIRPQVRIVLSCLILLIVASAATLLKSINDARQRGPSPAVVKQANLKAAFKRLFKYDVGGFLSHYDMKQVLPVDAIGLKDEDLSCLAHAKLDTDNINLSFTKISGSGLGYLNDIGSVKLELLRTQMKDVGYVNLGKLKNLFGLSLTGTKVTDEQFKHIATLPRLLEINIDLCPNLTNKAMKDLANVRTMRIISCKENTAFGDEGMIPIINNCPDLQGLQMDGTNVTDKTIEALSKRKKMSDIRLSRCKKLTTKSLYTIAQSFPELAFIGFGHATTKTTAADLKCLANCKKIQYLEFPGISIGNEEMKMFSQFPELKWLYLSNVTCTDEALKYLYPLKGMVRIVFTSAPNLSANAIAELRQQLPRTLIFTPGKDQEMQPDAQNVLMFMKD